MFDKEFQLSSQILINLILDWIFVERQQVILRHAGHVTAEGSGHLHFHRC
jgi:hypothetical protein